MRSPPHHSVRCSALCPPKTKPPHYDEPHETAPMISGAARSACTRVSWIGEPKQVPAAEWDPAERRGNHIGQAQSGVNPPFALDEWGVAMLLGIKLHAHMGRPRPTRLDFKAVPLKAAHGHFAMQKHNKKTRLDQAGLCA